MSEIERATLMVVARGRTYDLHLTVRSGVLSMSTSCAGRHVTGKLPPEVRRLTGTRVASIDDAVALVLTTDSSVFSGT